MVCPRRFLSQAQCADAVRFGRAASCSMVASVVKSRIESEISFQTMPLPPPNLPKLKRIRSLSLSDTACSTRTIEARRIPRSPRWTKVSLSVSHLCKISQVGSPSRKLVENLAAVSCNRASSQVSTDIFGHGISAPCRHSFESAAARRSLSSGNILKAKDAP